MPEWIHEVAMVCGSWYAQACRTAEQMGHEAGCPAATRSPLDVSCAQQAEQMQVPASCSDVVLTVSMPWLLRMAAAICLCRLAVCGCTSQGLPLLASTLPADAFVHSHPDQQSRRSCCTIPPDHLQAWPGVKTSSIRACSCSCWQPQTCFLRGPVLLCMPSHIRMHPDHTHFEP